MNIRHAHYALLGALSMLFIGFLGWLFWALINLDTLVARAVCTVFIILISIIGIMTIYCTWHILNEGIKESALMRKRKISHGIPAFTTPIRSGSHRAKTRIMTVPLIKKRR